jgi:O-antigen/teichoic acid export membrane protein
VLLLTMVTIQENWLARRRSFKVVAASMVVGTSVTGGARIGFGLATGSSVSGLIGGHMLGQICRLAVQKTANSEGLRATFQRIGWRQIWDIAVRYSDFPKLQAPAVLLTVATQQLPVVLFGVLFSPAVVGFYSMAERLLRAPIVLVARSVRRVFLQKAAEIGNRERSRSLGFAFLMTTGSLALLGAIPLVVLWFYGQPLATWLLGDRWSDAGRFLEIMAPWLYMIWITAPSNPVFIVLRKQRLWLILQIISTLLRLSTFGIAWLTAAGPEWTLAAFVAATATGNLAIIIVALVVIARHRGPLPTTTILA